MSIDANVNQQLNLVWFMATRTMEVGGLILMKVACAIAGCVTGKVINASCFTAWLQLLVKRQNNGMAAVEVLQGQGTPSFDVAEMFDRARRNRKNLMQVF